MTLTHRRTDENIDTGYIMLFATEGNEHYGSHIWTLESKLEEIKDCDDIIAFACRFYSIPRDEAEDLINPADIVDSAGAWDDPDFVSELWQEMELGEIKERAGFATEDGAVVLDRSEVTLRYSFED
jgi:hypothetical protein